MSGLSMNTVVVPIDFSDESIEAVDTALEIADQASNIHLVHVLPDPGHSVPEVARSVLENEERQEQVTQALRERLRDAKYSGLQIIVEIGDPGQCIVDYAENIQAELIVTPTHGRTGIKRLLIGSVAERVVRLAHCPVLVLRK